MSNFGTERLFRLKKYIPFIIFCVLTLLWVGFIFSNSAKTGEESGAASTAVVESVEGFLEKLGITPDISELFIRKLAHFLEYALLSLLCCADILCLIKASKTNRRIEPFWLISPTFCFLVANIDEFCVQASTAGRGPSFRDVCIDTSGALFTTLVFALVIFFISRRKEKRA